MSYGTIDFSNYPIIVLRMNEGDASMQEIDDFFDEIEAGLGAREGEVVIKTYGSAAPVSGKVRTKVGLRSNQLAKQFGHRALLVTIILPSLISRIMLKGVLLFMNTPVKILPVSTEEEANRKIEVALSVPLL